jgi:zinc protease
MKNIFITALLTIIFGAAMTGNLTKAASTDNMILLPVADDPTISFRIWFKVGSECDPKGKEGLALLTAKILTEGSTTSRSYEQILENMYPMAARYSSKVDREMTVIYGRVHKDNLDEYLKLITEALLEPSFGIDDFTRIKSDMINYIEKNLRYSSDEELGKAVLYNYVYDGTSYGGLPEGNVQSLKNITIRDVITFYNQYYTKNNYVIGLGGGYNKSLPIELNTLLGKLPPGSPEQTSKPVPAKIDGLQFRVIEKECSSTAISFGFPIDVLRGDEDFFALTLFNSWFGEHRNSSSHLYQVMREKRGLNYGDYSYIEEFLDGGSLQMPEPNNPLRQQMFEVWIRPVKNENRHFAIRAALRELKNVVDNGMTKDQFDLTKKFLYKYAAHYAPTTMSKLGYAIDSRFYGINGKGDYIELFRKNINSLTLDEVNKAIKKHLQYNNIKFAVVTQDAEKFKKNLVADIASSIKYVTPVPDAVLQEDKDIESFPVKVKADNVQIIPLEQAFEK